MVQNRHGVFEAQRPDADFPLRLVEWTMDASGNPHAHRHDVLEIGLCHAGSGSYLVEGRAFRFSPGTLVAVGEHEFHRAHADPGTTARWSFIFCDPARLLPATDLDLAGVRPAAQPVTDRGLVALAAELVAEARAPQRGHARVAMRGLLAALLARLARLPAAPRPSTANGDLALLAPALRLIAESHAQPLGIPALARACGLGPSAFRRRFSAALGQSPRDYLIGFRLHRAAVLLRRPGTAILDAALTAGFASPSVFHRHWQAAHGCSPRVWRDAQR